MTENPNDETPKSPSEKLAELVARRKAEAGRGGGIPGKRQSERGAAAFSASRSKPANRK